VKSRHPLLRCGPNCSGPWAWVRAGLALAAGLVTWTAVVAAVAACSRPIRVPVAPTGLAVTIDGERVGGTYPELLREFEGPSGCSFRFEIVPRARLNRMFFELAEADLFIPASRTSERDQLGVFVPLVLIEPRLVVRSDARQVPASLQSLRERKDWRMAVVRSHSFGEVYDELIRELDRDKRVDEVADLRQVVAMLRAGRIDFTILPSTLLQPFLDEASAAGHPTEDLRQQPLQGLPPIQTGAYLSRRTLSEADLQWLRGWLQRAGQDGAVLRQYRKLGPDSPQRFGLQPLAK